MLSQLQEKMEHYQNQYCAQSGTDQYGYPIRQTDEYGNVISETGQYADTVRRTDEFRQTDQYGNPIHGSNDQQQGGIFHHDKVVSTATAEKGGGHQEKKGIMEKIKEKLPGGHHWEVYVVVKQVLEDLI